MDYLHHYLQIFGVAKTNKKGIGWAAMATLIISLSLAAIAGYVFVTHLYGSAGSVQALIAECDEYSRHRSLTDIKDTISLYGMQQTTSGEENIYYDPESAMENFQVYIVCKAEGIYTAAQIEEHDEEMMTLGRQVYLNYADALCNEYIDYVEQGASEELQQEYLEIYEEIAADYYDTFSNTEDNNMAQPSSCMSLFA